MPVVFHQAFSPGAGRIWSDVGLEGVGGALTEQLDWLVNDPDDPRYIANKPTAAQQQSDWLNIDTTTPAFIQNKPSILDYDAIKYVVGPQGPIGPGALQPQLSEQTIEDLYEGITEYCLGAVLTVVYQILDDIKAELDKGYTKDEDGTIGAPAGGGGGDGGLGNALAKAALAAAIAAGLAAIGAMIAKFAAGATLKEAALSALSATLSSLLGNVGAELLKKLLGFKSDFDGKDADGNQTKYAVPDWSIDSSLVQGYIQHKPAITANGSFPAGGSTGLPFDFLSSGVTQLTDVLYIPSLDAETGLGCGLVFGSDVSSYYRDKDAGKHFYLDGCMYATGAGKTGSEDPVEFPATNDGYEYALADNLRVTKSLTCPTVQAELNLYTKKVTATDVLIIGDPTVSGRESKAGTHCYAKDDSFAYDIYGAGSAVGQRQLNLHDNVGVIGDLVVEGNLIVKGKATISGISAGAGWTTLTGGFKMQFGQFSYKPVYNSVTPNKYIYINFPTAFKTSCFSMQITPGSDTRNPESPVLAVDSLNLLTGTIMYTPKQNQDATYTMTGYFTAIGI